MSYTNYINKLSSETKKALEESSNVNNEIQELKKLRFSLPNLNDYLLGYSIKYKIVIDKDIENIINLNNYEILLYYFIENEKLINKIYIDYNIYYLNGELYISFYHTNYDYLLYIHPKIIQNIKQSTKDLSKNINTKITNNINLPFALKIKILKNEYPVLIQMICNIIYKKKIN